MEILDVKTIIDVEVAVITSDFTLNFISTGFIITAPPTPITDPHLVVSIIIQKIQKGKYNKN